MGYLADKPYGRRRTDGVLSEDEHQHLEQIRRDVDQDSTGLIRRYLRLSEKLLELHGEETQEGVEEGHDFRDENSSVLGMKTSTTGRAA